MDGAERVEVEQGGLAAARTRSRDWTRHRLAMVIDPRFPGGTSSAVADEIRALSGAVDLEVVALETAMFKGRHTHPAIEAALEDAGLVLQWSPAVVRADTIVIHNPSCLRFNKGIAARLSCAQAVVVTHENFLRPNGSESYDVAACLDLIEVALVAGRRCLAPVSTYNRETVEHWLTSHGRHWTTAKENWLSILDLAVTPPNRTPRDRRGRHSRPGLEKFPSLPTLQEHFPSHAERCVILGADSLMTSGDPAPPHWELRRFGACPVKTFLAEIDFFVYFTNPNWRESFGRVIAEAIAAGKLVITDPGTAASFGPAVVASEGGDVDAIIRGFCAEPQRYVRFVEAAQAELARFRPSTVVQRILGQIESLEAGHDDLV